VRFAPSPTGYFHVGSARTALFNWLFARGRGGTFVLRIEDTDAERGREEWVAGILDALGWLGLEPDEGPYRQSERLARYRQVARALFDAGMLYACDCSREAVEARRGTGKPPGYDGYCRDRGLDPEGRALRFRVPEGREVVVDDVVRGEVRFASGSIEDFVVQRSDGAPLFVLANVVDDLDMAITHVIRGEDLLPTTPKGLLLWEAIAPGRPPPTYAHLPMLVNERRQKLSKRRDPVALEAYRAAGYLPEAMRNYLALLGWSHPEGKEIFSTEEAIARFRLEDVNHAPAYFDVAKLRHVNAVHLRAMPPERFVEAARPWLLGNGAPHPPWPPERFDEARFVRLAAAVQARVETLGEVPAWVDFLFVESPTIDPEALERLRADPDAPKVLEEAADAYQACGDWTAEGLHELTRVLAERMGFGLSRAQMPIRVAVTGRRVGPPLFESLEALGRDESLRRVRALAKLLADR
jgi:glutamyl-tRNA synthetase